MAERSHKPKLVWFKAQAPGFRKDGSALATERLAEALSESFELHLVCLQTPLTTEDPAQRCCPPFSSVRVVTPDHQRSRMARLVIGTWYHLLEIAGVRPIAQSVEGCRSARRALREEINRRDACVTLAEYWTTARSLQAAVGTYRVLRLLDVEHINADQVEQRGGPFKTWRRNRRVEFLRRSELKACSVADRVIFVSDEDHAAFRNLNVNNGTTLPITSPSHLQLAAAKEPCEDVSPSLVFLGDLGWWPNRRGLEWFLADVFPLVRQALPSVRMRVLGAATKEAILRSPGQESIDWLGFVDDLPAALAEASVGVVPVSAGTGAKTKTVEFLAAGLPVVSTTNGVRGTSGTEAGVLIADTPAAFADAVLALLFDDDLRQGLVSAGRLAFNDNHGPGPSLAFGVELIHASEAFR